MCEILNAHRMGNKIILDCSPYNGDFMNASILEIIDINKNSFRTRNFKVEKTRSCFAKGGSPWVMIDENISDNFLTKGNEVSFS